jgi:SAM-dependent methyltransferase
MQYLDDMIQVSGRSDLLLADLGGTRSFWEMNLQHLKYKDRLVRIDLFNLDTGTEPDGEIEGTLICRRAGDITCLKDVPDRQYDIAFSNSAIEHTGNLAQQHRVACEIRRIAGCFVLQTPNRYFPLEPHFYVPFFALLPLEVRVWLHRHFKLGWMAPEPDALRARIDCEQIRLLSGKEIRLLFPGADIHREFLMGLVKSFIITGEGAA